MRFSRCFGFAALTLAGACARAQTAQVPVRTTVSVPAAGETEAVATANADAADDPAIFASADNAPFTVNGIEVTGLILGTDKKAGLYAFGLNGRKVQFLPEGRLNNVDLRADGDGFIAAASNRTPGRDGISLYRYRAGGKIEDAGFIASDLAEPYGFCMGRESGRLIAVLIGKSGSVREYALSDAESGLITGEQIAKFDVGSQSEGCVVDDRTGYLYLGEEDVGIWRYRLGDSSGTRQSVGAVGDGTLVADVEGMSILADGSERYLLVSSQGDSAFAVWRIDGTRPVYAGRFRVSAANGVDAVTGTDGIDAHAGPVGRFGSGLVVVQDDENDGAAQNFKLIDWHAIRAALRP
ncbi:phytase [Stakelama pacifica]|uniref:3-phytase n=1 Tax=Stakelama pacifica TaxID=517720 RepID=A0A4R6FXN3_9SPHN|nr:phytase [Stakelama pacifica]TDN86681.1 3-phytase [Stakelama pacifica]GGO90360.1 hypothetical protein GCM10011329_02510 [Stakelama pacifica]